MGETETVQEPTKELKPFKPSMLQNRFAAMLPKDLGEAMCLAKIMAESDIVPKEFQKKPANLLIAIGMGGELGLSPFQAMQNIMVVNGKPAMWGDAVLGLVRASGKMEYIHEVYDEQLKTAVCKVKRVGEPEIIRTFSVADATEAKLINKSGPWQDYRRRMLQMRARSWALRDGFTDILKGLQIVEEARDIVETTIVEEPKEIKAPEPTPTNPIVDTRPDSTQHLIPEERKKIVELMTKRGLKSESLATYLEDTWKIDVKDRAKPTAFIPRERYAEVCAWIENPQDDLPVD